MAEMPVDDLLKRLEMRSWELSRASAADEKDRYMNVIARLSREDGELMRLAAISMRALLLLLALSSPASAQMTATGCDALSQSAGRAASNLEHMRSTMTKGSAFHDAIEHMPQSAQAAASKVEATRSAAAAVIKDYVNALRDFSEKIKDCGKE